MADKNYFPKDFLFGAATSAYQFEGAAREEGKGPSVQDVKKIKRGQLDFSVAADHYHHLDEDLNLLAELGVKSYRFSISWSRIMPAGTGAVNQAGLAFYHRLIAGLLERDIVPIVTLFHFDLPAKLEEEGGWANRQTITAFVDYAKVLFAEFGADVPYWLTINEQNAMVLAGGTVAASAASFQASFTGNHNMLLAQARVFADYHAGHYLGTIGPAPNIVAVYPATDSAEDAWAAENFSALRNWLFLDPVVFGHYNHLAVSVLNRLGIKIPNEPGDMETLAAGKPDFIAFNYYNSSTVKAAGMLDALKKGEQQSAFTLPGFFSAVANKNFAKTDFGWEIDPKGLRTTANQIYSRYGLPLMITENGIGLREEPAVDGVVHDERRIDYLKQHLLQVNKALKDGVPLLGYQVWSAFDLISTHNGFEKRYGLVYIDQNDSATGTLARTPKDSFYWYQKVIKSDGASLFK